MISALRIDRFKSIRRAYVEFGRVNLFIGGNGAGKSNILEAIGIIAAALDRGIGELDLSTKGVRISPPELMKSAFKNYDLPKTFQLTFSTAEGLEYRTNITGIRDEPLLSFFSEKCTHREKKLFGRSNRGAAVLDESIPYRVLNRHRSIWDQVRTAFALPDIVEETFSSISQYAIYSPQTDFLRGRQVGKILMPPVGLRGEGLPEAVRGLIEQYDDINQQARRSRSRQIKQNTHSDKTLEFTANLKRKAIDLVFLPNWARLVQVGSLDDFMTSTDVPNRRQDMVYFIDKYMHKHRQTLSAYDSSEGTLFLLFVAVLLAHDQSPRLFALDNVDSALNPAMTKHLLEGIIDITRLVSDNDLSSGPRQIFLTSHNPSALDAFDLFDEEQRVFVVERDEEGLTNISRLVPRKDMSREDWFEATNGRSLSHLWLDGWIEGALGGTGGV